MEYVPDQIALMTGAQANVPLMRKHTADILHGTNTPYHFATFQKYGLLAPHYAQESFSSDGHLSHLKCRNEISFLSCVRLHLGLYTNTFYTKKCHRLSHKVRNTSTLSYFVKFNCRQM